MDMPPGPPPPREGFDPGRAPDLPFQAPAPGPRMPNRAALVVIGVALIAGAGVGVFLSQRGGDGTTAVSLPAGWSVQEQASDGFRLGLPSGWQELPPGDIGPSLDEVRQDNPELAELVESQLAGSLSELVRFFAFDPESPTIAEGFATNVNVVVEPLPSGIDFEKYLQANLTQLRQVPGVTVEVRDENLSLPAGRSAHIRSRFTLNSPTGARQIDVTQYVFIKERRGFILSLTTTPAHGPAYAPTFDQIAQTFQLL